MVTFSQRNDERLKWLAWLLILIAFLLMLIGITSCEKPEDYCYECSNKTMNQMTYCGYSEGDIRAVMAWWENQRDTLTCKIIKP